MSIEHIERNAESRIAEHRMGDFRVRLTDQSGEPVAGAKVEIELERHDFRLGANGFKIRSCEMRDNPVDESLVLEYEDRFAKLMNYATLPFYWGSYEPVPGEENTERLRTMAEWCQNHDVHAKGHPLAWHEVFPAWAEKKDDEEVVQLLRNRIGRIVRDFQGLVDTWDVFNETTVAGSFDNAVGRWVRKRGSAACVEETLALAREANPEAELLYNDYNVSGDFERLVEELLERKAPIDAIGIQSHMHKDIWSAEQLWETCETYAQFGLPLHFTELTILSGRQKADGDNDWHRRRTDWPTTEEGERRQLKVGRRLYTLLFSHPAVDAVTWWDFSDYQAWQGAPAGLLREDMSPKPLAKWLHTAFADRWSTETQTRTDEDGEMRFHGFFGTYTIQVNGRRGERLTGKCTFPRRSGSSQDLSVSLSPG